MNEPALLFDLNESSAAFIATSLSLKVPAGVFGIVIDTKAVMTRQSNTGHLSITTQQCHRHSQALLSVMHRLRFIEPIVQPVSSYGADP
jgi:hypothetical protein